MELRFFLFLQGLGFIIYFLPLFIRHLFGAAAYDRKFLSHCNCVVRMEEHAHMEEKLNAVLVEDAMAVGENREKRTQYQNREVNGQWSVKGGAESE